MNCDIDISNVFSVLKDVCVTGAALTGAYVAVRGLSAWRLQLHGKADYELARQSLKGSVRETMIFDKIK
jgi:hypothetical protein